MTVTQEVRPRRAPGAAARGHHPGMALAVIAASQLMVVLDATIVNIALPHIQGALHFSTTSLSWVLNAYTLTFGGLLLLGGRAGDILGRRRVFVFGLLLFSFASLLGGMATSSGWLLAARALQGVGAAIAAPTALALITTNFAEGPARNRAFGVFAAVAGSGAAIGLLAGGMLTSWLSWRWVLFVNVPIGILLATAAPLYLSESERQPGRFDLGGALTSTAGMAALVYGFIRAAQDGWSDTLTLTSFAAAAVLLATFIAVETRTRQPITPLHMFADRNRAGAYVIMLTLAAALFGMFFFLTLFVQDVLGYSPLRAGFAFLPVSAAIIVSAQLTSRRLAQVGPKRFMVTGAALAVLGLSWLTQIGVDSNYLEGILGPMLLFGVGMGLLFVPLTMVAVAGVVPHESGAASSLLNVMQQVGGSLGLSILVTVFGTASRHAAGDQVADFMANATPELRAAFQQSGQLPPPWAERILAHGISTSFQAAVVFALIALVACVAVVRGGTGQQPGPATEEAGREGAGVPRVGAS
ncbi:MAG TPA: MFS transporter [Actinomycetes bacterium]|nr:MFS transporter [Actinomycetes bacterium]